MKFGSIEEKVIYDKLTQRAAARAISPAPEAARPGDVPSAPIDRLAGSDEYFEELCRRIATMEATRQSELSFRIEPQPIWHPIKWFKYGFKRLVRKCTTWAAGSVFTQQTMFNNAVVPSVGRLTELSSNVIATQREQQARINGAESRAAAAEDRAAAAEGQCAAAVERSAAVENRTAEVEGRTTAVENRTAAVENRTGVVENRVSAAEGQIDAIRGRMATAEQLSTLENRLTVAEKMADYLDRQSAKADQLSVLENRLAAAERTADDMGRQSARAEQLSALENRLAAAERMAEALDRQAAKADQVSALEGRLTVAERMADYLDRQSARNDQLAALEGRVAVAEQTFAKTEWLSTLQFRMDAMESYAVRQDRLAPLEEKMQMVEKWYAANVRMMQSLEKKIGVMEEQGLLRRLEQIDDEDEQRNGARRTLSQSGEDCILAYVARVMGIPERDCTYLDLGANHAKQYSNTWYFYDRGARGVLVEANPALIPELKLYRSEDTVLNCCISDRSGEKVDFFVLNGDGLSTPDRARVDEVIARNPALKVDRVVSVETMTVNQIMDAYFDRAPVYMNIDLEGDDQAILSSIDWEAHRPLMVTIEMIPYRPRLVVGEKDAGILAFMESVDYIEYAFTGINSIFLDKRRIKDVLK